MSKMTKINWNTVLKIIVAVASAILGTLGVQGMAGCPLTVRQRQ